MTDSTTISSQDLFDDGQSEGIISPSSASILTGLATRIDRSMQPLSVAPTITTQTLVGALMDNSPSMNYKDPSNRNGPTNAESVIEGHNLVIEALTGAKAVNSLEMLTQVLHPGKTYIQSVTGGSDVFKWTPLRAAPRLLVPGYLQGHDTPLYDRALELLGSVIARTKWWEDEYGVSTTTRTLIMSDGESNAGTHTAGDVRQVVEDMLAMEKHQVFFLGVKGYDDSIDFRAIARGMGIPDDKIGVVPSDPRAIRAWFTLFSQSATSDDDIDVSNVGFGNS